MNLDQPQQPVNPQPSFVINVQYIKDLSYEVPNGATSYFYEGEAQPSYRLDLNILTVAENLYEVALISHLSLKIGENTVFVLELDYRGVFTLSNISNEEELQRTLFVNCAQFLFPFARAIIQQIVTSSNFSPPAINPIDFMGLYLANKSNGGIKEFANERKVAN
jgi:preprotein translocase subunit SecB